MELGSDTATPTVVACPGLPINSFEKMYIFNGDEDMFIRNDYGTALCAYFNKRSTGSCTLTTFSNAGHGVLYSNPSDIFVTINAALE